MRDWKESLTPELVAALKSLARETEVYLSGGALRDFLLGRPQKDLDLTVPADSLAWAQFLARRLKGRVVVLHEEEGVVRVALPGGGVVDFSAFRQGARDIFEDLRLRDFTVNALAVPLSMALTEPRPRWRIIDPTSGLADLEQGRLRAISQANLKADPLRLLRGYRFLVELGFELAPETRAWVRGLASTLHRVAKERVSSELRLLFEAAEPHRGVYLMAEDGLLAVLFPELEAGRNVPQPGFHHLDVLGHNLLALEKAALLLKDPTKVFDGSPEPFAPILASKERQAVIRLAALFHDVGKPVTFAVRDRITFYEHDQVGAEIVEAIGERLRWPRKLTRAVSLLVRLHMRPFHLLREFRLGRLTPRAMRRLLRACPDYPDLFLVAMADSLASAGPDKDPDVEPHLAALFREIDRFYREMMLPVVRKRLVTGRDLIDLFGLTPGPLFRELLEAVEEARVEGLVHTREEALDFLGHLLQEKFDFSS